jgi:hypothetical protein
MKYKLLKDTPTIKAGTIFEKVVRGVDGIKGLVVVVPIGADTDFQWTIKDIDNFDEWFEEIQEPTDSIHWEPEVGEKYWFINEYSLVSERTWTDDSKDFNVHSIGGVFRTAQECMDYVHRRMAEARLQRTSNFKPNFENGNGGWLVGYDHEDDRLLAVPIDYIDYGEPVRYATEEEAKRSISENREDWLAYLGIKED